MKTIQRWLVEWWRGNSFWAVLRGYLFLIAVSLPIIIVLELLDIIRM